ncbi:hypothetical protein BGX26_006265 [Mortierella sp. AD094]|nr:hypothetical protein BGX26_006265 [Mortierella sp. AD094]
MTNSSTRTPRSTISHSDPLVSDGTLIGIASQSEACGLPEPNIYVDVSKYQAWISNIAGYGDRACAVTNLSKSFLAWAFDVGNNGRKCDFILKVGSVEVANFEAKRKTASKVEVAAQFRKNAKINESISLTIDKCELRSPPLLHFEGLTVSVSKLDRFEDI